MLGALKSLPPVTLVTPPSPGSWCAQLPLWGNPLLRTSQRRPLERSKLAISAFVNPAMTTLGDLIKTRKEIAGMTPDGFIRHWKSLSYAGRPADTPLATVPYTIFRTIRSLASLTQLLDAALVEVASRLPEEWFDAAQDGLYETLTPTDAEDQILSGLGWQLHRSKFTLKTVTVKAATNIQLLDMPSPHLPKIEQFAALITPTTQVKTIIKTFTRFWALPCEARLLTAYWRLVLNGHPTAERIHGSNPLLTRCGCTHETLDRIHLYHECPILHPVLTSVLTQFSGPWSLPASGEIQRHHLWLAHKPHPTMQQLIWDIVVIHLIDAFDEGRCNWMDRILKLQPRGTRLRMPTRKKLQGSNHRPPMEPGENMVASVGMVVLAEFWSNLNEFVTINTLPEDLLMTVPLDHPFIQPDPERKTWCISHLL